MVSHATHSIELVVTKSCGRSEFLLHLLHLKKFKVIFGCWAPLLTCWGVCKSWLELFVGHLELRLLAFFYFLILWLHLFLMIFFIMNELALGPVRALTWSQLVPTLTKLRFVVTIVVVV